MSNVGQGVVSKVLPPKTIKGQKLQKFAIAGDDGGFFDFWGDNGAVQEGQTVSFEYKEEQNGQYINRKVDPASFTATDTGSTTTKGASATKAKAGGATNYSAVKDEQYNRTRALGLAHDTIKIRLQAAEYGDGGMTKAEAKVLASNDGIQAAIVELAQTYYEVLTRDDALEAGLPSFEEEPGDK